ncbi:MAG TPA: iron-containing redox enzyme family protein [Burkholderiaceae bacterium]|jgi:pyrroloquinoline quinone (PQQ) biosynthesis protein C|nr:iron-containing redox enzyme family protein [Burkholderiaceae bacterium]
MAKSAVKLTQEITPAQEFEAAIQADLQRTEHRYLRTPLLEELTSGSLPKESIKDYAILRWAFQAHANPAMMLSHACFLLGDDVEHLLENVYDEIFRPKGEGDHPGLWVEFAKRLGATDEELKEVAENPLAEVIGFPRTLTYFTRQGAPEGLTTWYADEAQLPEAHGATALALRKFYGLDDATIEYFLEHVRADLEHSEANESLIGTYVSTREDVMRARRAGAVTLWAWREMHEGMHRVIRKKYGLE